MAKTQRIDGDLVIDPTGSISLKGNTRVEGDLTVVGTTTSVETTNTDIKDRQIVLNKNESGAGVTGQYSGIEVDRGSSDNAWLVFDESVDRFRISYDNGSTFTTIATSESSFSVFEDPSPQLSANLDLNGNALTSVSNGNVIFAPQGTGNTETRAPIQYVDEASPPSAVAGSTVVYADTVGQGGTGLFFAKGTDRDEFVSKKKAIIYALVF